MTVPTSGCLFSILKNTSGGTKHFGFLPPHGVTLTDNQEISVFGDVYAAVYRNGGHKGLRAQNSLAQALADGDLEIISTPCAIVYDVDDASYRIGLKNAGAIATEPSYDNTTYTSVAP